MWSCSPCWFVRRVVEQRRPREGEGIAERALNVASYFFTAHAPLLSEEECWGREVEEIRAWSVCLWITCCLVRLQSKGKVALNTTPAPARDRHSWGSRCLAVSVSSTSPASALPGFKKNKTPPCHPTTKKKTIKEGAEAESRGGREQASSSGTNTKLLVFLHHSSRSSFDGRNVSHTLTGGHPRPHRRRRASPLPNWRSPFPSPR